MAWTERVIIDYYSAHSCVTDFIKIRLSEGLCKYLVLTWKKTYCFL